MSTYLHVPFSQKDRAKSLGARFDAARKQWFVPDGVDPAPFAEWDPAAKAAGPTPKADPRTDIAPAAQDAPEGALTLSALLSEVREAIRRQVGAPRWVVAEVTEGKLAANGHLYLTLAELLPSGQVVAEARAVAFKAASRTWFKTFQQDVGEIPSAGMRLLLQVTPSFDVRYGFSFQIEAIDPAFTLGDFAKKLQRLRETLRREGRLERQRRLPTPTDFTRIALLAPAGAAGLGDFRRELDAMAHLQLVEVATWHATFQGPQTEETCVAALAKIAAAHARAPFDALVILRGGGSQLDLDWLNTEGLARAVADIPLPVLVGIGHERDTGILDDVAHQAFDTPSKVAAHIRRVVVERAQQARHHLALISRGAEARVARLREGTANQWRLTATTAQAHQARTRASLTRLFVGLAGNTRARLERAQRHARELWGHVANHAQRRHQQIVASLPLHDRAMQAAARTWHRQAAQRTDALLARIAGLGQRRLAVALANTQAALPQVVAAARARMNLLAHRIELTASRVDGADPARILARGYALALDEQGKVIRSASTTAPRATLRFADGERGVTFDPPADA